MKSDPLSDSLPTINADQLTKAVSLAAGGALSDLDTDNPEDDWSNKDPKSKLREGNKTTSHLQQQTTLELLESLSTSVTSNLSKLNQIDLQQPCTSTLSKTKQSTSGPKNKQPHKNTAAVFKKYSSRKNYKLLPPLIPSQIQASLRKATPETVTHKQLVTISHNPNPRSPLDIKNMPVRLARYTTNYVFVRTAAPAQSVDISNESTPCKTPVSGKEDSNATLPTTSPLKLILTATTSTSSTANKQLGIPLAPKMVNSTTAISTLQPTQIHPNSVPMQRIIAVPINLSTSSQNNHLKTGKNDTGVIVLQESTIIQDDSLKKGEPDIKNDVHKNNMENSSLSASTIHPLGQPMMVSNPSNKISPDLAKTNAQKSQTPCVVRPADSLSSAAILNLISSIISSPGGVVFTKPLPSTNNPDQTNNPQKTNVKSVEIKTNQSKLCSILQSPPISSKSTTNISNPSRIFSPIVPKLTPTVLIKIPTVSMETASKSSNPVTHESTVSPLMQPALTKQVSQLDWSSPVKNHIDANKTQTPTKSPIAVVRLPSQALNAGLVNPGLAFTNPITTVESVPKTSNEGPSLLLSSSPVLSTSSDNLTFTSQISHMSSQNKPHTSQTAIPPVTTITTAGETETFLSQISQSSRLNKPHLGQTDTTSIATIMSSNDGQSSSFTRLRSSVSHQESIKSILSSTTCSTVSHLTQQTKPLTKLPLTVVSAPYLTHIFQKPDPAKCSSKTLVTNSTSLISSSSIANTSHHNLVPSSQTFISTTSTDSTFSTAAAVAAMVSLSETKSSLLSVPSISPPNHAPPDYSTNQNPVSNPQNKLQNHFLVPSSNKAKLVISPAGIQHLQSLLRKQGISEGYFVITSPRVQPPVPEKPQQLEPGLVTTKSKNLPCSRIPEFPASSDLPGTSNLTLEKHANMNHSVEGTAKLPASFQTFADEDSNSDSSSSTDSRSSSRALVIETGEDDEQLQMDNVSSPSSDEKAESPQDPMKRIADNIFEPDNNSQCSTVEGQKVPGASWETSAHSSSLNIPQSPLSLTDLIRQQQNRGSFSRQIDYNFLTSPETRKKESDAAIRTDTKSLPLPSSESEDFAFPLPVCPASSYCSLAHTHQSNPAEMPSSFQHGLYSSSSSLYSNDMSLDHHSSMESRTHMGERTSNSPKNLSTPLSMPSPKSPLSLNSNQPLDHIAPLNPPMTPNTMLINLLNRVPTPLLTNHQDLLTVPTSQENNNHDPETGLGNFYINGGKRIESIFAGKSMTYNDSVTHSHLNSTPGKNMSYPDNVGHSHINNNPNEGDILYRDPRALSSSSGKFRSVQNALDLITSSYSTSNQDNLTLAHEGDRDFNMQDMGSKPYETSFSSCHLNRENEPIDYSENYQHSSNHNSCQSFHCKSCSDPLVVRVNLDSESNSVPVTLSHRSGDKRDEELLATYEQASLGSSLNIQKHNCLQETSNVSPSITPDKSAESDTDILRHLILNTGTSSSSYHSMQRAEVLQDQHFSTAQSSFSLSQNNMSPESQFRCQVDSFLEPENTHKNLPDSGLNQSSPFNSQNNNFLHLEHHTHSQPSPTFNDSDTNFKTNSFQNPAHQSYENTATQPFDSEANSALGSQAASGYIMPTNLTEDSSFNVQDITKNNMPLSHDFLGSNERLQHLNGFQTDTHQDGLFYQHPHPPQANLHEQQNLHHYNPTHSHQDLEYHMDDLPSTHQTHQYPSSSLSHPDSSRIFTDHRDNVGFMDGQYSSQYYDTASVSSNLPMFSQQCAVGSEAPQLGTSATLSCNIPFSTAPTGLHLEYRFPPDDEDGSNIEKQPVLPSASFSPPSVADQAATPDPSGMNMYNGTFPNLSMYEMYVRGGNPDGRGGTIDAAQELGNFCVECNMMYKAQCKFHPCDYTYISDTPILSHARLTLPNCLRLATSDIAGHTNNTGVFAKESIAVRTKFGPLIGSPVSCDKLGSTRSFSLWQTFIGTNAKVVDTSDENSSNWLMFVKPARLSSEQNLVAFQHGSSVYFVTRVNIEPGQELLYWFAKDYARMLGISAKPKNAHHQLCPHCTVCKQVFPDRKQVRNHIRLQHPKPCTKKCSQCNRKFSQVSHLNAHIASVHLRDKKYVCPQCGKRFSDSSNFRKHVKAHSDERCFKCQLCGKDFRQKAHLKHHMNTHMPVKNEQCGICGERFTRAFTRKQHELQHTKQNKIQCVHCDKIFYKQQVYKQHLKIHINERNYVCTHCSKAFRTKANLTRHGPACKQKKCILPLPPVSPQATLPPPPLPTLSSDFLHPDVNLSSYNDTKTSSDSVQ
ncbi:serine-rich adhesin for platelets-like [Physella acuta]|uniref:serine-rich adhesin for platelets-like n=1 Tax=Physella acuta TaxID=109671 RepID=UPI0027DB5B9D|nr:serine-rich adhesin for platelets-like [Physella acuta]XP_059149197.1 serine-rich adhesin for platelets-like [Physella acuta]